MSLESIRSLVTASGSTMQEYLVPKAAPGQKSVLDSSYLHAMFIFHLSKRPPVAGLPWH